MKKLFSFLLLCFTISVAYTQTTVVKGMIKDSKTGHKIPGADIKVIKGIEHAVSDFDGEFTLEVNRQPPFEIKIFAIGYGEFRYTVTKPDETIEVALEATATGLDQIVISASRTPERVFESPVTIERIGPKELLNTTSPDFYDGLENKKGVDINTSSLVFKSINTRGFATFANTRFVQLVDGMDNSSPGLNFPLGNLIGLNELDVYSVEILPGASSALYGANAFNGMLFMTSKNPFVNEGIDVYGKTGVTSSSNAGTNSFVSAGFRVAKKVSDKFAVKLTGSLVDGTDWFGTDTRNIDVNGDIISGSRESDPNYNGINVFGDLVSTDKNPATPNGLQSVAIGVVTQQILTANPALTLEQAQQFAANQVIAAGVPAQHISRTGYTEQELSNSDTNVFRLNFAAHFRPFGDKQDEITYNGKLGTGNTLYQGASRYAIRNFIMQQHKLEYTNDHLLIRTYLTAEDAGDSYDIRFAGINLNSAWKDNTTWFGEYAAAYLGAFAGQGVPGGNHTAARAFADRDRLQPGTAAFNTALNRIKADPDVATGSKFVSTSKMYHSDVIYRFKDQIDFADVIVGASARVFELDSDGTIYTDPVDGVITFNEYGVYTQMKKGFFDEKLQFTGALRYDKSQNFEGKFTPKLSATYTLDNEGKNILRGSFQTGFRNPTTQDQYIGLNLGGTILVGTAEDNLDRDLPSTDLTARQIIAGAVDANGNPVNAAPIKQEQVSTFEVGYRSRLTSKVNLDINAYYSSYRDFIALKNVSVVGSAFQYTLYTNTDAEVASYGANVGLQAKVFDGFDLDFNYTFAKQDFDQADDPNFETSFNTPEHKVKLGISHDNVFKGFGFGLNGRWQDEYLWESSFVDGVIEARTVVDAQITYPIKKWNSVIKVGGSNIFQEEYVAGPGAGLVGGQYFASWTLNF